MGGKPYQLFGDIIQTPFEVLVKQSLNEAIIGLKQTRSCLIKAQKESEVLFN